MQGNEGKCEEHENVYYNIFCKYLMVTAVSKHTAKEGTEKNPRIKIIHQGYIYIGDFGFGVGFLFTQNTIYLLYISTSGFHNLWGGIRKSLTPPYSDEFHRKFMSFHSLKK